MNAPTIELVGVSKRYEGLGEPVVALRNVTGSIPAGEYVSVEGPSGCGKTTLLNLLGLLDVPSEGEIRWDGRAIAARTERERSRLRLSSIGFIFQRFYLLPTLTATENVALPMRAAGMPRAERDERAHRLLREMGLSHRFDALPHQLSGGEEQRVAIARALANEPGLLLADEPTGELDRAATDVVLRLLEAARERAQATLVVVTHNPLVAARARRHLRLEDGMVVQDRQEA
ncbi:MAG: ABC transporter ATP-binding protein [Candidatus Thermoplasmatota archaeon]|nr:ABC transporter ATP-binding protein [Candidatus Thermoplasmatota archaeon]MCL5983526.1 ABC transporter ATP-binding protein [Candidatus Thermoplasmatota archaeon]